MPTLLEKLNTIKTNIETAKSIIATSITSKGVTASSGDSFSTLRNKINQIARGQGNAVEGQVFKGKTFTNADGVLRTGTLDVVAPANYDAVWDTTASEGTRSAYCLYGYYQGTNIARQEKHLLANGCGDSGYFFGVEHDLNDNEEVTIRKYSMNALPDAYPAKEIARDKSWYITASSIKCSRINYVSDTSVTLYCIGKVTPTSSEALLKYDVANDTLLYSHVPSSAYLNKIEIDKATGNTFLSLTEYPSGNLYIDKFTSTFSRTRILTLPSTEDIVDFHVSGSHVYVLTTTNIRKIDFSGNVAFTKPHNFGDDSPQNIFIYNSEIYITRLLSGTDKLVKFNSAGDLAFSIDVTRGNPFGIWVNANGVYLSAYNYVSLYNKDTGAVIWELNMKSIDTIPYFVICYADEATGKVFVEDMFNKTFRISTTEHRFLGYKLKGL